MGTVGDEARQGERQHVFVVNHDPPFLDVVRELLRDEAYNITTRAFRNPQLRHFSASQG